MSKACTALQNATFPQPFCSLAYKKQFVLCSFPPCILMQAIRLPLLCSSDNYQNSYVQLLFQASLFFFFPCIPYLLIYVFSTAEQQCAHSLPALPPVPPGCTALRTQPQGSHVLTSIDATLQSYRRKNRVGK